MLLRCCLNPLTPSCRKDSALEDDRKRRSEGRRERGRLCTAAAAGEGGNVICRGQKGQEGDFNSLPVSAAGMTNLQSILCGIHPPPPNLLPSSSSLSFSPYSDDLGDPMNHRHRRTLARPSCVSGRYSSVSCRCWLLTRRSRRGSGSCTLRLGYVGLLRLVRAEELV